MARQEAVRVAGMEEALLGRCCCKQSPSLCLQLLPKARMALCQVYKDCLCARNPSCKLHVFIRVPYNSNTPVSAMLWRIRAILARYRGCLKDMLQCLAPNGCFCFACACRMTVCCCAAASAPPESQSPPADAPPEPDAAAAPPSPNADFSPTTVAQSPAAVLFFYVPHRNFP